MAHANNVVAVLRVVGAAAEASVGGRVRGVSHKVDTEHAAVGGGRVLVPLRREGGTWVATKPSNTHQGGHQATHIRWRCCAGRASAALGNACVHTLHGAHAGVVCKLTLPAVRDLAPLVQEELASPLAKLAP